MSSQIFEVRELSIFIFLFNTLFADGMLKILSVYVFYDVSPMPFSSFFNVVQFVLSPTLFALTLQQHYRFCNLCLFK